MLARHVEQDPAKFMTVTGAQPRAGMKVLMKVYPQFHEAYGFSWIVTDIDPTYTLGDMARRRQEIVRRLKEEGVFDLNKQLPLPLFAQRIAVVSSQTAAGLGDFCISSHTTDMLRLHHRTLHCHDAGRGSGAERSGRSPQRYRTAGQTSSIAW